MYRLAINAHRVKGHLQTISPSLNYSSQNCIRVWFRAFFYLKKKIYKYKNNPLIMNRHKRNCPSTFFPERGLGRVRHIYYYMALSVERQGEWSLRERAKKKKIFSFFAFFFFLRAFALFRVSLLRAFPHDTHAQQKCFVYFRTVPKAILLFLLKNNTLFLLLFHN